MTQFAIYIDDNLAERLEKAVAASGKSKSKWISDVIKSALQDQWPDGFFELAGSWIDKAGPNKILKQIRQGMDQFDDREEIS